jgi:hypothetical protein
MSGFPLYWVKNIKISPLFTTFAPFLPLLLKNQRPVHNYEQVVNCFISKDKAIFSLVLQALQRLWENAERVIFWTGTAWDINNCIIFDNP